jgi:hypothetical protein
MRGVPDDDLDSMLDEIDGGVKPQPPTKTAPKTTTTKANKFTLPEDDDWNVPTGAFGTRATSAGNARKSQ